MFPDRCSASTGVSTSTVPIFDSAGQPAPGAEDDVSDSNCGIVQTPRPEASDGFAVYPTGNVTFVSFRFAVAIEYGFSQLCGTTSEMFKPLGDSAARVVGCTSIEGLNGTRSH